MFCSNCGKPVDNTPFCSNCGAPVKLPAQQDFNIAPAPEPIEAVPIAEPVTEEAPAVTEPVTEAAPAIAEPVTEEAPAVTEPVTEAAPAIAEPVTEEAPTEEPAGEAPAAEAASVPETPAAEGLVTSPAETPEAEPAPSPIQAVPPMQEPAPVQQQVIPEASQAPKKKSKAPFIILGVAGGVIVLAAIAVAAVFGYKSYTTTQKYNDAMKAFESGNYVEAKEAFEELGDYEESEYYAEYADVQIESDKLDKYVKDKDFKNAISILKIRERFFGDQREGKEAKALIKDYEFADQAFSAMDSKDYNAALDKFNNMSEDTKRDYDYEIKLCGAYSKAFAAKEENDWMGIIANLYGIQRQDLDLRYLTDPASDEDKVIADAYNNGNIDYDKISSIMNPKDPEQTELCGYALKGLYYDKAVETEKNKKYDDAISMFTELGDFLDSKDHLDACKKEKDKIEKNAKSYAEAEKFFNNGEFYKAYAIYKTLGGYKDSKDKAAKCEQPLPENGSMKKNGGSGVSMKITAPSSSSVFLKFYNSKGESIAQIFIRAGEDATVKLNAGTYTIKAAYGTKWYGDVDMFGEEGSYSQLLNGSEQEFKLKNNYKYNLRLMASVAGNVGSNAVPGGASGM